MIALLLVAIIGGVAYPVLQRDDVKHEECIGKFTRNDRDSTDLYKVNGKYIRGYCEEIAQVSSK